MIILAVESSCDETAVALVRDGRTVLADCIASSVEMHRIYGGVVPEIASRKHIEVIAQLADQALEQAGLSRGDIDAVAVTYAPGLIGAVLVGVSFAKSVAYALGVPLIPVHHVRGHIAANYLAHPDLEPPFVCLCVSGGTSLLVDVKGYTEMEILGATRDDAAGECFDKIARVMGLGYPGGAPLDRAAQGGNDKAFSLPRVHIQDAPLDMSFSGLKTAMLNLIHNAQQKGEELPVADLAASFSAAVSEELVPGTMAAAQAKGGSKGGGGGRRGRQLPHPPGFGAGLPGCGLYPVSPAVEACGDNGSMIGSQGYEYLAGTRTFKRLCQPKISRPYGTGDSPGFPPALWKKSVESVHNSL